MKTLSLALQWDKCTKHLQCEYLLQIESSILKLSGESKKSKRTNTQSDFYSVFQCQRMGVSS